jgi:putative acetyltransferase
VSAPAIIRDYHPEDCETLATIYRRSVREIAAKDYTPEQILAWAPDRLDMARFAGGLLARPTFVAEIGGVIAGFTDLESDGHIDLFYINPDFQRRGVARALINFVIARARALSIPRLHAEVSRTARPFFERHGFTVVVAQEVEIRGQKLENFRMERWL